MNGNSTSENWTDPDDAPKLTAEWFEGAVAFVGDTPVRRGRPKAADPKQLVSLRLDRELVEKLRAQGPGWQTRVNDALRKVVGL